MQMANLASVFREPLGTYPSEGYAPKVIDLCKLTFPFIKYTFGDSSQHSEPVCVRGSFQLSTQMEERERA